MLTDEQVETYLRCTIGETSQRCEKCMNFEQWDDDMQCEFGPEQAKALLSDRAELKVEVQRLEAAYMQMGMRAAELEYTVQHHEQEIKRLRAIEHEATMVHPAVGLRYCEGTADAVTYRFWIDEGGQVRWEEAGREYERRQR